MKPPGDIVTSDEPATVPKSARCGVAVALLAVLAGALFAGCGSSDSPGQAVPGLDTGLDRVDAAISSGHLGQARSAVDALIETTRRARRDGDLSAGDATHIIVAAQQLRAQLPTRAPTPQPSATPSPPQTNPPNREDGGDHGKHVGKGNNDKKNRHEGHSDKGDGG